MSLNGPGGGVGAISGGTPVAVSTGDYDADFDELTGVNRKYCRGLSFSGTGDIVVKNQLGDNVTLELAAGLIHPCVCRQIITSGTDVTNVIAWF